MAFARAVKVLWPSSSRSSGSGSRRAGPQIVARKRPLVKSDRGDFDVVVAAGIEQGCVEVHECVTSQSSSTSSQPRKYVRSAMLGHFDIVFGSRACSAEVYTRAAAPLVADTLANRRPAASLLVVGAAGSGRTYTLSTFYRMAVADVFAHARTLGRVDGRHGRGCAAVDLATNFNRSVTMRRGGVVELSCFELADGGACQDLLCDGVDDGGTRDADAAEKGAAAATASWHTAADPPAALTLVAAAVVGRDVTDTAHFFVRIRVGHGGGSDHNGDSGGAVLSIVHVAAGVSSGLDALTNCVRESGRRLGASKTRLTQSPRWPDM